MRAKAPTKPAALTVDAGTLADLAGVTRRRIEQLAVSGVIPKAARGKFPLYPAIRALVAHFKAKAKTTASDLREEMTRKMAAQADSAEVKAEIDRKSVIPRDDVARFIVDTFAPVREQLLAMPGKIAPRVNAEAKEHARVVLQTWVNDTLAHCREKLPPPTDDS